MQQADGLVAISKELFSYIAVSYMNSEHRDLDTLIASADDLQSIQRERNNDLENHMYEQQVGMQDSFIGLCKEMREEQRKQAERLEGDRKKVHEGSILTQDSDQLVYAEGQKAYLDILPKEPEDANAKLRKDLLNSQ